MPFIYLVIIQQWVFHAFLELESQAKRESLALSAGTAPVAWLGLSGTTAAFLGAACPGTGPGWHQVGEEMRGQSGIFIFVYFNLSGYPAENNWNLLSC